MSNTDTKLQRRSLLSQTLRSGEFKQGHRQLRDGDEFCCLGVACEVYRRKTGDGKWIDNYFQAKGGGNATLLPFSVQKWFGFSNEVGSFVAPDDYKPASEDSLHPGLTGENDNGADFETIADLIDRAEEIRLAS